MRTKILKWVAITALVLAATWPSPTGYYVLLGFGACVATIWALRANRVSKWFLESGSATVPRKVKYEN